MKMKYKLRAYGITRDILGDRYYELELKNRASVADLRRVLYQAHPRLQDLKSLMIAVNDEYAEEDAELKINDDIALIPPVSGG